MCSINHIYGDMSINPFSYPEFDLITPSPNHTVLFKSTSGLSSCEPFIGGDRWDSSHVKMPNSQSSQMGKPSKNGKYNHQENTEHRWKYIQKALEKEIKNFKELLNAILSYNLQFKSTWKFPALERVLNQDKNYTKKFFEEILPNMQKLALRLPELIKAPIPLLKAYRNHSISISQLQISCLLANAFFCTFPRRNATGPGSEFGSYPKINFSSLFECYDVDANGILEKIQCIIHYFDRVCSVPPDGFVTFSRRYVDYKGCPSWYNSNVPISSIPVHLDSNTNIEDALGLIQVDFANKMLGGGVLGNGCVQEEIRFVICPELFFAMLVTEELSDREALMIIGCERYSKYSGYGRQGFQFRGDYYDETPRDNCDRRKTNILAIDATKYYHEGEQFRKERVDRELNKAWVGFSFLNSKQDDQLQRPGIATGNWGCGVFNGSPELKALIQIMACAEARRPMAYYTFSNQEFETSVSNIYLRLCDNEVTVGQLYKIVLNYCKQYYYKDSLFNYVEEMLESKTQGNYERPLSGGSTMPPDNSRQVEAGPSRGRSRSRSNSKSNLNTRHADDGSPNLFDHCHEAMDTSGSDIVPPLIQLEHLYLADLRSPSQHYRYSHMPSYASAVQNPNKHSSYDKNNRPSDRPQWDNGGTSPPDDHTTQTNFASNYTPYPTGAAGRGDYTTTSGDYGKHYLNDSAIIQMYKQAGRGRGGSTINSNFNNTRNAESDDKKNNRYKQSYNSSCR